MMELKYINLDDRFGYFRIDNFLTKEELSEVWLELEFISYKSKLLGPDQTNSAKGRAKKLVAFIDQIYTSNKISSYTWFYKKHLLDELKHSMLVKKRFDFVDIFKTNSDHTLFNYYEDGEYYDSHTDTSKFTQVLFLHKEPKKFSGGDFSFPDFLHKVECNSNTLIFFPSYLSHKVEPVVVDPYYKTPEHSDKLTGFGRYSLVTFFRNQP